jgi:molybdopterin-containing oxidoreductase family membrane subunit
MWFERFNIIVTSLHRDFLPSSWADYAPTLAEIGTLVGSFGLFLTLFLLFCRFVPVLAIAEVKAVVAHQAAHRAHGSSAAAPSTSLGAGPARHEAVVAAKGGTP